MKSYGLSYANGKSPHRPALQKPFIPPQLLQNNT